MLDQPAVGVRRAQPLAAGLAKSLYLFAGQELTGSNRCVGAPARRKGGGPQADGRAEFIQFFSDDGDPDPTAYRRGIPQLLRQMQKRDQAHG